MVLGHTGSGTGRRSGCQYSLMPYLWHSERLGVSECHKAHLREIWHSEHSKSTQSMCLWAFPRFYRSRREVQGAKNTEHRQGANILSKGGKPNAGLTPET